MRVGSQAAHTGREMHSHLLNTWQAPSSQTRQHASAKVQGSNKGNSPSSASWMASWLSAAAAAATPAACVGQCW